MSRQMRDFWKATATVWCLLHRKYNVPMELVGMQRVCSVCNCSKVASWKCPKERRQYKQLARNYCLFYFHAEKHKMACTSAIYCFSRETGLDHSPQEWCYNFLPKVQTCRIGGGCIGKIQPHSGCFSGLIFQILVLRLSSGKSWKVQFRISGLLTVAYKQKTLVIRKQ